MRAIVVQGPHAVRGRRSRRGIVTLALLAMLVSHTADAALRAAETNTTILGTSLSITLSSSDVDGAPFCLAQISVPGTPAIAGPNGWTLIRTVTDGVTIETAYYYSTACSAGTYEWDFDSAVAASGGIGTYTGVDLANPINAEDGRSTPSGTSHSTPSINTTVNIIYVVALFSAAAVGDWTPPRNFTERWDSNTTGVSIENSDEGLIGAGFVGPYTASVTVSAAGTAELIALQAAVQPAATPTPTLTNTPIPTATDRPTATRTLTRTVTPTPTPTNVPVPCVVDSIGDGADAAPGDFRCDDGTGACTLRAAIGEANAGGCLGSITFAIAGAGPHTISPGTDLPAIAAPNVVLDGATQAGSSCGDLWGGIPPVWQIMIAGTETLTYGIRINSTGGVTVNGLLVQGFSGTSGDGIEVNTSPATLTCNRLDGNATGIAVNEHASGVVIGGTAAGDGNVVVNSGSGQGGIELDGEGTVVQGNFVGVEADGTTAAGNEFGIASSGTTDSVIGGATTTRTKNLISGNRTSSIFLRNDTINTTIGVNWLGVTRAGDAPLKQPDGIELRSADSTTIDGVLFSRLGAGIHLFPGSRNTTVQNSLFGTDFTGAAQAGLCNVYNIYDEGSTGTILSGNTLAPECTGCCAVSNAPAGSGPVTCFDGQQMGNEATTSLAQCQAFLTPIGATADYFNPDATCQPNHNVTGACPAVSRATPTPTGTPTCVGDCHARGTVSVDDLITMVNVALGSLPVDACLAGDGNGDGTITVEEIVVAVNHALVGCALGS